MSNPESILAMFAGGCLIVSLVMLAAGIAVAVFYMLTLQKALNLAGPQHQRMVPGMVWLLFIPLFNLVWHFIVVKNVSDSIKSWAVANGKQVDDAGYTIGLIACICACCVIIPFLGALAGLGAMVCFIIWWIKVAGFNKLMSGQA